MPSELNIFLDKYQDDSFSSTLHGYFNILKIKQNEAATQQLEWTGKSGLDYIINWTKYDNIYGRSLKGLKHMKFQARKKEVGPL